MIALLPAKMDTYTANTKDDNVTSNIGMIGTTIHRSYGTDGNADLSIIGNSPIVTTLNAFLNTPFLGKQHPACTDSEAGAIMFYL